MKKAWGAFLFFSSIHAIVFGQSASVEAWVDIQSAPGDVTSIIAQAKNLVSEQGEYNYSLEVNSTDANGNSSSNSQFGTFTIFPGQLDTLTVLSIKQSTGQQISIDLRILVGHIEVARDFVKDATQAFSRPKTLKKFSAQDVPSDSISLAYPNAIAEEAELLGNNDLGFDRAKYSTPTEKKVVRDSIALAFPTDSVSKAIIAQKAINTAPTVVQQTKSARDSIAIAFPIASAKEAEVNKDAAPVEGLEIDGLIIDETRTKAGRDFYSLFYSNWQAPDQASNFSVVLKEYPARGRISRLGIEVNGKLVLQSVLQPRQELLEMSANQAISVVQRHLLTQQKINTELDSDDQSGSGIF